MTRLATLIALCALCGCQQDQPSTASGIPSPGATATKQEAARSPSVSDLPADANFVLPGTFSERTTVADLQARFGTANVKIPDPADRSGSSSSGVVLFPDDPARRAYVGFHDDAALSGLALISVRDAGSRWRGKHDVHIGMSLADLRRANGKSFYFSGFDSEHRAWAHDQWSPALDDDDDRLGALDVEEDEHMYFGVQLGLRGQAQNIPPDAYPADENSVSSDDPRYPKLGEIVEVTEMNATTSLDDEWE